MPRPTSRRPEYADLNADQRELYDALPPEFRSRFLDQLPDIKEAGTATRKKIEAISKHTLLLAEVIGTLRKHHQHLDQLVKDLEAGASPEAVDLRRELSPPAIPGVVMRYVRGSRTRPTSQPHLLPLEEQVPDEEPKTPRRGRSKKVEETSESEEAVVPEGEEVASPEE
jgi:hypothetical protein